MLAVISWFRLDLRRRWKALLVLALLVALATATVTTAAAGAKRGASAVDRLLAQTLPATALAATSQAGFDWDVVRALPGIAVLAEIADTGFEVDGQPALDFFMPAPMDAEAMRTIERPAVLQGRLADPAHADEVVVSPAFERSHGKTVGDTVTIGLYTPEQIDTLQYPFFSFSNEQMEAARAAGVDPDDVVPAAGPVVTATIVGVVRSPLYSEQRRDQPGFVVASAGLYAEYPANLLGADRLGPVHALVRLDGGEDAVPAMQQSLKDLPVTLTQEGGLNPNVAEIRSITGFEAASLYVFAWVAALAAVVLIGLVAVRYAAATVTDAGALRAVGMSPLQVRAAPALALFVAGCAGSGLGAAGAVAASRLFPVGRARLVEPAPGIDVDVGVLLVALLVVPSLMGVGAFAAAALALRSDGVAASPRRSVVASRSAAAGLPVPVVVGARFALEPGQGGHAVPVRPALAGSVTGVVGVLGALTFASGVDDAAADPARKGAVHQVVAYYGLDGFYFGDASPADVFGALGEVPGVTGVNSTRHDYADADGTRFLVSSFDPIGEPLDFVVTDGRLPVAATEVMLGMQSAERLGAGLGDAVSMAGTVGEAELVVVGVGLVAPQDYEHATGALVTPSAYDALFDGFAGHFGYVGLAPGVEPREIIPRLHQALSVVPGADVGIQPLDAEQRELEEFRYIRVLPFFLAGFLTLLALGAVGYAVATTVRRRSADMAVLRAQGLTPGQARGAVYTQALLTAFVGLLLGIPLGVALGRTVWRVVAETMYVHYLPPVAVVPLLLVPPAALLAVSMLALLPGHRAATMRLSQVLRAE